jgi:hypothetical protein
VTLSSAIQDNQTAQKGTVKELTGTEIDNQSLSAGLFDDCGNECDKRRAVLPRRVSGNPHNNRLVRQANCK